jgi:hypothetical protein
MPGGSPKDARWCFSCPDKPPDAVNVTNKSCLSDWCEAKPGYRHRGYCLHCFANLFPDDPFSRNYKVKETAVREAIEDLLRKEYPNLEVTFDKAVRGGCSKRRPDTFIDALTHCVFGEVDENQHDTAKYCACENKRLMSLMQDIGMRPVVFIRLNPDAYVDAKGRKHMSCFRPHKKAGRLVVRDKKALAYRIEVYINRIRHHLQEVPSQEVQVEHLFYDGFAC